MRMSQISFVVMKNSISMLSFPSSHIVFSSKIHVVLVGLEVCFFAKRVRVLVKDFQDYHSLICLIDYQVRWHAKIIKVIYLFFKAFNVLRPRLSQSSLP